MSLRSVKNILLKFVIELGKNGKLLIGYIASEWPGLVNDYPGLYSALLAFAEHADQKTLLNLLFQLFLAGAAGQRLVKILKGVSGK